MKQMLENCVQRVKEFIEAFENGVIDFVSAPTQIGRAVYEREVAECCEALLRIRRGEEQVKEAIDKGEISVQDADVIESFFRRFRLVFSPLLFEAYTAQNRESFLQGLRKRRGNIVEEYRRSIPTCEPGKDEPAPLDSFKAELTRFEAWVQSNWLKDNLTSDLVETRTGDSLEMEAPIGQVDTPSPTETTETGIAIEESGGIWTVAYEGRNTNLRGGIGLRYLQILLSRPNEEIPCLKLFSLARERDPSDPRMAALTPPADPVVDTWTLRAVEKQLAETKAELEDAKSTHDIERQEVLQERLTKIEGYIAGARGIGGKTRVHSTPEEKARKSVGRAIDRGVQKIRGVWPELASQLDDCVERGACCRYTPLLHGA